MFDLIKLLASRFDNPVAATQHKKKIAIMRRAQATSAADNPFVIIDGPAFQPPWKVVKGVTLAGTVVNANDVLDCWSIGILAVAEKPDGKMLGEE
ncbi:hypothetical protein Lfu02_54880 [Longispora fulva]|uniref:Uncharacterized protein n=1 Tax=Longispora fulva TaxID=619741 RepID=A0A8J7GHB9_9ACTN|nr:hypothetical protein [Longispora fulva]MBG6137530.1 hypothetical protein [Longispora fulva]GIG61116.1 hypothetical protein Lfu02_54880 [Longispora fulva]